MRIRMRMRRMTMRTRRMTMTPTIRIALRRFLEDLSAILVASWGGGAGQGTGDIQQRK